MVDEEITFNVVFTPGTVRYLMPAVYTLLDWASFRFRLVGNALSAQEAALLHEAARSHERLSAVVIPAPEMLPHGLVLSLLYRRFDDGACFAFCDPDIFAIGPYEEIVWEEIRRHDVFSSCYHVSLRGRVYGGDFVGRSLYAPTGAPLPTTFFAVYRRASVERIWKRWGIGFERYLFEERIPEPVVVELKRHGLYRPPYDTAKLLNALQTIEGAKISYRDIDTLYHVGGICRALLPRGLVRELARVDPVRLVWRRCVLTERTLTQLTRLYREARAKRGQKEEDDSAYLLALRTCVAYYFAAFLRHLVDGTPRPLLRLHRSEVTANVRRLCAVVEAAYRRYFCGRRAA